jgi:hypothetical protein
MLARMLLMPNPTPLSATFALGLIGIGYGMVSGLTAGGDAELRHSPPPGWNVCVSRLVPCCVQFAGQAGGVRNASAGTVFH